ncbi:integrin alpha-11 isoform X3 [Ciona intestinalis]
MFELSVTFLVFLYSLHAYGFNLDEEVVQREFPGSGVRQSSIYFGYTVSLLSTSKHAQELFVGSPFDTIRTINDKQLAYRERSTGNLYRCGDLNLDNGVTFVHRKNCSIVSTSQETSVAVNPLQALTMSMVGTSWDEGQSNLVVCNNMWTRNCKDAYKTEGVCYVTNTTSELNVLNRPKWKQLSPCKRECYKKMIDFMFVVDGSRSVGNESFEVVKNWIQQVTSGFDISSSVQVGVVQYSTYQYRKVVQPFIKTEINLGQYKDHTLFDAAVDQIKYHDRSTFTAYAIRKTVNEDFKGNSSRDLSSAAAEAKQEGVETFAVGVGSKIILSELVLIAGSLDKVITVNDFHELLGIVNQLQGDIQLLDGTSNNETNNHLTQCQAGTSSTLSKSGRLILGAPGAYDWAGTITKYDSASDTTADIPTFTQVQGVLPNRTKESYLGYSVSTGLYDGSGKQFVASGAPRYMLEGGVVLYEPQVGSSNFTNSQTIQAYGSYKQLGSYFGATLLSVDINGDGKDDLLVGAPLYIGDNYDEGRVFVYLSQASNSIQAWASPGFVPKVFSGMKDVGGRFGSAISSAADLNNDGFNDVIIGAPLADNGAGVVYVYHGNSDFSTANSLQYKQRIAATALSGTNLQYFGQSLQGGVDLDGNLYPDVAVGAPRSDTVVIFRTRPVAKFNVTLTFNKLNVPIFKCFRREFRDCLQLRMYWAFWKRT